MALLNLLATDFLAWLMVTPDGVPRRVLLWLDPHREFERLVRHLGPELEAGGARLLTYDPEAGLGQLGLKLALLRLESEVSARAVVYLPDFGPSALEPRSDGTPPELWSVYEYGYKGCVWGRGDRWEAGAVPEPIALLPWLGRHGCEIADSVAAKDLTEGGADSLLARYVERQRATDPVTWPRPLRVDDVRAALGGDPRVILRALLSSPHHEVKRWGDDAPLILDRLADEYGLGLPSPFSQAGGGAGGGVPNLLADHAAIVLALADAWDAFGRPADFPFIARLPPRLEYRDRLARFLREDVLSHVELGPRFRERVARLESDYDLTTWAKGRAGQPGGLPRLARSRWAAFLERLGAAASTGWKAARQVVLNERPAIDAAVAGPWGRADTGGSSEDVPAWAVVSDLAALLVGGMAAGAAAEAVQSSAHLIATYAAEWWNLDRLHRRVCAASARRRDLVDVRRLADLAYFDWVARASDRFATLVESAPSWPPPETTSVAALRAGLWSSGSERRAVIIADAFRWELAVALRERLEGTTVELTPIVATLPTETPFGMTALLPLGESPVTVEFPNGKLAIRQAAGPDLTIRDGRKAFLRAALVNKAGKSVIDFVDLVDLLGGTPIPATPIVVIFDNALDERGHKGTENLPAFADAYVDDLKRAIDRLHTGGIETVHVVTDHGFLLLPPDAVDALGHPPVPPNQVLLKDFRWAMLKPDVATTEVLKLALPLDPQVTLGLPRGARTLIKAEPYLHGGLSLQECVIPYLVSRAIFRRARLGLDLRVRQSRLTGGVVSVSLRPVMPEGQFSLGGVQPITVRIQIDAETAGGATRTIIGPIDVDLRPDAEEIRPPVYLPEGLGLRAGQELRLRATDKETGQDLGTIPLTMDVDFD